MTLQTLLKLEWKHGWFFFMEEKKPSVLSTKVVESDTFLRAWYHVMVNFNKKLEARVEFLDSKFIFSYERTSQSRKIAVDCFLISPLFSELQSFKKLFHSISCDVIIGS